MPNSVLATRFNNLQTRIRTVLGTSLSSNPQFGYGQSYSSRSVTGNYDTNLSNTNLISTEEYATLYEDIVRARVHQIGSTAFTSVALTVVIAPVVAVTVVVFTSVALTVVMFPVVAAILADEMLLVIVALFAVKLPSYV